VGEGFHLSIPRKKMVGKKIKIKIVHLFQQMGRLEGKKRKDLFHKKKVDKLVNRLAKMKRCICKKI